MPKYKLLEVPIGGFIYLTDGGVAYRADTREQAIEVILHATGGDLNCDELDSMKLAPQIVYKRDLDAGEYEYADAEPGDTWYMPSPDGVLFWTAPYMPLGECWKPAANPNPEPVTGEGSNEEM